MDSKGKCEVAPDIEMNFYNGKMAGAKHFAEAAITASSFDSSIDFASHLDSDGHWSHIVAITTRNNGIPVRMHRYEFGKTSGMAPEFVRLDAYFSFFGYQGHTLGGPLLSVSSLDSEHFWNWMDE